MFENLLVLYYDTFHGVCRVSYSWLYIMERSWAAAGLPAACPELCLGLRPEARVSGAEMCDSKHCLVFT
jgi:hypothetical protein